MKKKDILFLLLLALICSPMTIQRSPTFLLNSMNPSSISSTQKITNNLDFYRFQDGNFHENYQKAAINVFSQYEVHEPIEINNDASFAALGFPGDGSPENPYIIAGLNITSSVRSLINIRNTNAFFCIRNNLLRGESSINALGAYAGIELETVTNGWIDTNIITNCYTGITLRRSGQSHITHNTVFQNYKGVDLYASEQNALIDNDIINNTRFGINLSNSGKNTLSGNNLINNALQLSGKEITHYLQRIVEKNTVNGRPLIFWQQVDGDTVPQGAGQILLIDTTRVEITGQDLARVPIGVLAAFSSDLNIHHNTISNCTMGIQLLASEQNDVSDNIVAHNREGICLEASNHTNITHNTVSNNQGEGMYLEASRNNNISQNTIIKNNEGVNLEESDRNTIAYNTIIDNPKFGILLGYSGQNTLIGNELTDNGLIIRSKEGISALQGTVENNTVNGGPLVFWQQVHGGTVPRGAGQIILVNTTNIEVTQQNLDWASIGVMAAFSSNLMIHHNTISNCTTGIQLIASEQSVITNNTVTQNTEYGISLRGTKNTVSHNFISQSMDGISYGGSSGSIDSNIVTNCSYRGISLSFSEKNTISHNTLFNNSFGIFFSSRANDNTISHNTLFNNRRTGIFVESARQNILTLNTVFNNSLGISIEFAEQNTLMYNTAFNNTDAGIRVFKSKNNHVINNTVSQNGYGILLGWWTSEYNTISHNLVFNNSGSGIKLYESGHNTLIGNILINDGLSISGREVAHYLQATVTDNIVNGRPLVFWQQVDGGTVPPDAGQVILIASTGVEVTGQTLSYTSTGVFAYSSSNLNIHHNTISDCGTGIYLVSSDQNILSHNTLVNNTDGISLSQSGQNTLVDNDLINNGLVVLGSSIAKVLQATVTNNTVNGRPLVFWQQVDGGTVPPDAGQVILIATTGVEVAGQNLSHTSVGMLAVFSSNLTVHHNHISHCGTGILLTSEQSILSQNILSHNRRGGIHLAGKGSNTVFNNTLSQNGWAGIYVDHSLQNVLSNNTVFQNTNYGIYLIQADGNIFSYNNISQNMADGINIDGSHNNTVTHNTIFYNSDDGIHLSIFGQHTITQNIIFYNKHYGIHLEGSSSNNVTSNIILGNADYGIFLTDAICIERCGSDYNTMDRNIFIDNNLGGDSQASDSSRNNNFTLNYWNTHENMDQDTDGITDTPYPIAGLAHNQDVSPRASIPPITIPDVIIPITSTTTMIPVHPEFFRFELVLMLMMIFLLFKLRKQRHQAKNKK